MTRYLRERTLFGPLLEEPPSNRLGMVVVIPAKDEPNLLRSLESLADCEVPTSDGEVIVVINSGENDAAEVVERNARLETEAREWAKSNSRAKLKFEVLNFPNLPHKHAGVGLARKIGMDEGCRRLEAVGNPTGALLCFDADSRCDPNYLREVEALFRRDESCQACSIYFEHPMEGREFVPEIYDAIIDYELHLRYFVRAQRHAGLPHAFQTIGSSMAVRCDAYQAQNGMNRRKAGEDFYFLHKFTPLGTLVDLNSTRVIPSPRPSDRVPFGTGKAVGELIETDAKCLTYHPSSFQDLRSFVGTVDSLFELAEGKEEAFVKNQPESVRAFLETQPFWERVAEIRSNVTTRDAFRSRFFRWFSAFLVMKFVHHARDHFYPDCEVGEAAKWLLEATCPAKNAETNAELLKIYRELDRA
tara:strand:+ start:51295 stop:52542 length:1248 start_codon:yes stop_codon:yes gene_type:complete